MNKLKLTYPDNIELNLKYDEFHNKFDDLLRYERSRYYNDIIDKSDNTVKTMWEIVNSQTGRDRERLDFTEVVARPDGSKFLTKSEAVNYVNAHFVGIATTSGAPTADIAAATSVLAAARPPADRSLLIRPFTPHEILRILTKGVARKKSKDAYGISISLLNSVAQYVSPILSCLYNQCRIEGRYPLALKQVKVSPLYKGKGKQEDVNNYRPVSIIPGIAKIFEHGLSARITEYLTECQCLSDRQYAYRKGRSTTSLAVELVRRVVEAREGKQQVAVIFCDLSKAFDVADHDVIAIKMKHYGLDGAALDLLSDFMTDRRQVVVGDRGRARSQPLETVIGVAQGSSLSNIMFSLLLNDLPECIEDGHTLMYADDVAVIVTAPAVDQLEWKLNVVANSLNTWFGINGLMLNATKTHFIHFNLAGRSSKPLVVNIGGTNMSQVESTNFVGFQLDRSFIWADHIDMLCGKIGRACFALWRISALLPYHKVRQCYFASVHSLLLYGIELWGRAADWARVFVLQKRAVRAIARVPEETSARPYFKSMGILTVPSVVCFQAAMYARDHIDEYAHVGDTRPQHPSRHARRLGSVPCTLTKTSKLIHVMAPTVFNRLPLEVRDAPTRGSFKRKLKHWLTEQAFYRFDDIEQLKVS